MLVLYPVVNAMGKNLKKKMVFSARKSLHGAQLLLDEGRKVFEYPCPIGPAVALKMKVERNSGNISFSVLKASACNKRRIGQLMKIRCGESVISQGFPGFCIGEVYWNLQFDFAGLGNSSGNV